MKFTNGKEAPQPSEKTASAPRSRALRLGAALLLAAFACLASGWTMPSCGKKKAEEKKELQEYHVERGDINIRLTAGGVITPRTKVEVKSEIGGKVKRVMVKVGDMVAAGEKIVELESADLQIEIDRAEAMLEQSRAQLQQILDRPRAEEVLRARSAVTDAKLALEEAAKNRDRLAKLLEKGYAAQSELDAAEYKVQTAKNQLDTAQDNLKIVNQGPLESEIAAAEANVRSSASAYEKTTALLKKTILYSPIAGAVLARNVEPGSTVSPGVADGGSSMLTIADTDTMFFEGKVDETDVLSVKVGQPAVVKIQAGEGNEMPGRVSSIAPLGMKDENITRFDIEVELETLPEWLEAGMSADAVITAESRSNALLMSLAGVYFWEGQAYVYGPPWVDGGTTTYEVTTGFEDGVNIEILSGMEEGQAYYYYADL